MRFIIYSLGLKGFNLIKALSESSLDISFHCVIGRDKGVANDYSDTLANYCKENGIKFSFRGNEKFQVTDFDYALAVGWRWIIHNIPDRKLIVFHDSLLPAYRGFAPLVNALLNKEKQIGVSVIFGVEDYDKGDIIAQKSIKVTYPTNIENETKRIAEVYADLAFILISKLITNNKIISETQVEARATYSLWRDEDDYRINWQLCASDIQHFIDCLGHPYMGASTTLNGLLVRIFKARVMDDVNIVNRSPGKVIFVKDGNPVVVCGQGLLLIEEGRYSDGDSLLPLPAFRSKFK